MKYKELSALPVDAFLKPEIFKTGFDDRNNNYQAQYEKGLRDGNTYVSISVAVNNTWGARGKDGSSISAYEGIGYHAGTAAWWAGVLDSACDVYVYRAESDGHVHKYRLCRSSKGNRFEEVALTYNDCGKADECNVFAAADAIAECIHNYGIQIVYDGYAVYKRYADDVEYHYHSDDPDLRNELVGTNVPVAAVELIVAHASLMPIYHALMQRRSMKT